MTSNTQYTAYDIKEDDYSVGDYILYKEKPFLIKSFSSGRAILEDATNVKTDEFDKEDNYVGEIVYLDEVPYKIVSFSGSKANLEYIKISFIDITNANVENINQFTNSSQNIINNNQLINNNDYQNVIPEFNPITAATMDENTLKALQQQYYMSPEIAQELAKKQAELNAEEVAKYLALQQALINQQQVINSNISETAVKNSVDVVNKNTEETTIKETVEEETTTKETKKLINTQSEIIKEELTKTNNITISTVSEPVEKIDAYGNVIRSNNNDWIGEDHNQVKSYIEDETSNSMSKSYKDEYIDDFGKLSVSIEDLLTFKDTDIDLIILDDNYNLHTLHLFYRNNYSEKVDMYKGRYRVYGVKYSDSVDMKEMYTDISDFTIEENKTVDIKIYHTGKTRENVASEGTVLYKSERRPKEKRKIPKIFVGIVIIVVILIISYIVIKKIKERR